MPRFVLLLASAALLVAPAQAAEPVANPLIDYDAFVALTMALGEVREAHRLPLADFDQAARAEGAILLDTRSAAAFAAGHLEGAVNLPFSDFTDEALLGVLGPDKDRAIYIYCNNNFADNIAPVMTKKAPLALNIPTFINLHGYGYANVWELADVVRMDNVRWVVSAGRATALIH